MTEDERELITRLVALPYTKFAGQCISKQEFLEQFIRPDGVVDRRADRYGFDFKAVRLVRAQIRRPMA